MKTITVSILALAVASLHATAASAAAEPGGTPAADTAPAPDADAPAQSAVDAPAQSEGQDIIVTGTRRSGITQAESPTPIKVIDEQALSHVGQPNLNQVLTQLVPSFTAQAFGGDTANLTLSARLRGLSPNHTLVLVNGKRRHGTSNLAVLGGPYQGAASPDLDLITPLSVGRIEVLEQGAAAQYGSDAIAGVINIILKNDKTGIEAVGTSGSYYDTGGFTLAGSAKLSVGNENGFFDLTVFHRRHDFSQVGGLDRRVTDPNGVLRTTLSPAQQALYAGMVDFPYVNHINGDAESNLTNIGYNAAYDLGGVEVYSFGTYSKRIASAYENVRVPDLIISSPTLGVAGTLGSPGSTIFDPDGDNPPNGFNPREGIREDDFSFTGGVRGEVSGFHYDLSGTWGQDKNLVYTLDTANRSLYIDTHFTPTTFYDGSFKATEWTLNADFTKDWDVGFFANPITFAFGAEYRKNIYQIGHGDPGSIYKEGGQSYPGFRPSDAGSHSRHNWSGYFDAAIEPIDKLKLDGAVRYEDYSDFGSKAIYKFTGRYDVNDAIAFRGTISTGFRAPTLAESYYSATNVSPTSAFVQLPANSAAAKLLGFSNLRPEKSTTYSIGTVIRPLPRLTLTVDAFQVRIRDRILGTGSIYGSGGATNFPIVTQAIIANGNVLDPTVSQTGINIFTNGADTRTRGVDVVLSYMSDFGNWGKVNWTISGTWNETKAIRILPAPSQLTPAGGTTPIPLFDKTALSNLQTASPRVKVVTGADWSVGDFTTVARGTLYGVSSTYASPNGGTYYNQRIPTAFIVDLEESYTIAKKVTLTIGANNLFNKKPPIVALVPGTTSFQLVNAGNVLDSPLTFSPYGINGGYYYGRISLKF